jgi:hypothetical protein
MHKSPGSENAWSQLGRQRSYDTGAMVSVRSNTRFFKAVKEDGFKNNQLSMPISKMSKVNVSHMPLNQIPFRLTQHPHVPFAISASDNAYYEEYNAKERERLKKEKLDAFHYKAIIREELALNKLRNPEAFKHFEEHIKHSLKLAIEFSLKTNMIKKTGANGDHNELEDIKGGPPTFNGTDRDNKFNDTNRSEAKNRNVDLHELQSALEDGLEKNKIIDIIDKIIDDKESEHHRQSEEKPDHNYEYLSPEEIKRDETPNFDYAKLQGNVGLLGIPPRDFEAYIPILRILKLENYDKNEFEKFDMVNSLKLLKQLWKTSNTDKIEDLLHYGIFQEVMQVEERKAVRRNRKGNK